MKQRPKTRHRLAASVLTLIVALTSQSVVLACSCDLGVTTAVALEESSAVFEGTVIGVDHRYLQAGWLSLKVVASRMGLAATPTQSARALASTRYSFRVERVWKGVLEATVVVTSDEGNCSFPFDTGTRYVVFAYGDGSELTTNSCTGTAEMSIAQDTVAELMRLAANAKQ